MKIYATPILVGCTAFVLLRGTGPPGAASAIRFNIIFGLRALAIYRHLEMPGWLTLRDQGEDAERIR